MSVTLALSSFLTFVSPLELLKCSRCHVEENRSTFGNWLNIDPSKVNVRSVLSGPPSTSDLHFVLHCLTWLSPSF